ncbi:hypothetical protein H0H93_008792, partial [Arthromyces matolae]
MKTSLICNLVVGACILLVFASPIPTGFHQGSDDTNELSIVVAQPPGVLDPGNKSVSEPGPKSPTNVEKKGQIRVNPELLEAYKDPLNASVAHLKSIINLLDERKNAHLEKNSASRKEIYRVSKEASSSAGQGVRAYKYKSGRKSLTTVIPQITDPSKLQRTLAGLVVNHPNYRTTTKAQMKATLELDNKSESTSLTSDGAPHQPNASSSSHPAISITPGSPHRDDCDHAPEMFSAGTPTKCDGASAPVPSTPGCHAEECDHTGNECWSRSPHVYTPSPRSVYRFGSHSPPSNYFDD